MNSKQKILILAGVAALLLIAFFTNPSQADHVRNIRETLALRRADKSKIHIPGYLKYNNYIFFSTTSCLVWIGQEFPERTLSHGYFGRVETNDEIEYLPRD